MADLTSNQLRLLRELDFYGAFSLFAPIPTMLTTQYSKKLASCHKMGFEGIVSKRRASAYRSGPTRDWLKIKTAAWRAANGDRGEMFDKRR